MIEDEEPLAPGPRFGWPARLLALVAAILLLANLFRLNLGGEQADRDLPSPSATPSQPRSTPPTPSGRPSRTGDPLAAMPASIRAVAVEVERIRGLRFLEPVDVQVVTQDRLDARLAQLIRDELDREEIRRTERTWATLGLLPPGVDLFDAIIALNEGGVAGFYDDESEELLVGTDDPSTLSPLARYYVAHELTHALTDQHHDLSPIRELEESEFGSDASFAYRALVEGDAVHVAERYRAGFTLAEHQAYADEQNGRDRSSLGSVPPALLQIFGFPYDGGPTFVSSLLGDGGFAAVDRAYRKPPTSTREILHPAAYPAAKTSPETLPALPDGWNELEREAIGEFDVAMILDKDGGTDEVSDADAARAADGWRAGRFRTAGRDGASVVEIAVRFSTVAEREEADAVIDAYFRGLSPEGEGYARDGWVGRAGDGPSGARRADGRSLRLVVASGQAALDAYLQG